MAKKPKVIETVYRVWVGDDIITTTNDYDSAKASFDKLPKGTRPTQCRALERIEVLENDLQTLRSPVKK